MNNGVHPLTTGMNWTTSYTYCGLVLFCDSQFIPWSYRVNQMGEMELLDDQGQPLYSFFYDASVELGVKMREGTINDVVHSLIDQKQQVKHVLQYINLQTSHRQPICRILACSFKIPITNERALINGNLPQTMSIKSVTDLSNTSIFHGGNIVFLCPDERVHDLRGLEFNACALIGFFGFIKECGSSEQWQNVMRWLSSSISLTRTDNTGEKIICTICFRRGNDAIN
ncbi:LOW QUALITY PROTEIN: hypothetical protein ACHAWF_001612, partial [Thalassiosira exigua]